MTADMRSVSEYNGVNSYCMLRFSYRLNTLKYEFVEICVRRFRRCDRGPRGGVRQG